MGVKSKYGDVVKSSNTLSQVRQPESIMLLNSRNSRMAAREKLPETESGSQMGQSLNVVKVDSVGAGQITISLNENKAQNENKFKVAFAETSFGKPTSQEEQKIISDLSKRNWGNRTSKKRNLMTN